MPKKVFATLLMKLRHDIEAKYRIGAKYLSTREISEKFGVSLQTAHRGVRELVREGLVEAKPKSGIVVMSLRPLNATAGRKVVVYSNVSDRRFNNGFLSGIREVADREGITIDFIKNSRKDVECLSFGEYLLNLKADGVIALSFRRSALPFYHALREGLEVVSDIIIDELPLLPAVQPDNYRHSLEAGVYLAKKRYEYFLIVGYFQREGNRRLQGFCDGVGSLKDNVHFVSLTDSASMSKVDEFLHHFNSKCAVMSLDYAANYVVASKLLQHSIRVANDNFMVFDSEDDEFSIGGLPAIRAAAPSLKTLGREMCESLSRRWKTGAYMEPLQRKL